MSWHIPVWLWLVHTALGGSVVLLLGCLALRLIRQPALRLRVAELTLLGCLLVPWAGYLPFLPCCSVALPASGALPASPEPDPELGPGAFSGPLHNPLTSPFPSPELPGTAGDATWTRAAALTSASQLPSGMGMPFCRRSASVRHSGSPATITSL